MKLKKPVFDKLLVRLKEVPDIVHARDAKLFAGKKGTPYEPFEEITMGGQMHASYLIYATINSKTLPIDPSIIPCMLDFSGCETESCDVKDQEYRPRPCICAAANGAIDAVIDKPLEVLAMQLEGKNGIRPKWQIWMLRDGNESGYLHDSVARALSEK